MLVDEIRVQGREVHLKGSYGTFATVVQKTKPGHAFGVPSFGNVWSPGQDSKHVIYPVTTGPLPLGYAKGASLEAPFMIWLPGQDSNLQHPG